MIDGESGDLTWIPCRAVPALGFAICQPSSTRRACAGRVSPFAAPPQNSKPVMEALRDRARLVVLEDCGHADMMVLPRIREVFVRHLEDYLR
jgi:hypothetical protein